MTTRKNTKVPCKHPWQKHKVIGSEPDKFVPDEHYDIEQCTACGATRRCRTGSWGIRRTWPWGE